MPAAVAPTNGTTIRQPPIGKSLSNRGIEPSRYPSVPSHARIPRLACSESGSPKAI